MKVRWKLAICIGIAALAGCGMMAGGGACDPAIGGAALPSIDSVTPMAGYAGTRVTLAGSGFGEEWEDNHVMIGTVAAHVVTASPTQLEAIVGIGAKSGAVSVEVNGNTDAIADDFEILDWPATDSGEDGPPIFFEGHGLGPQLGSAKYKGSAAADKLPSTGQLQVLVIPS
ncbi:MAG: IPT/TIG domain-containing protein, partial [Phycisphaerae bacterium]